MRLSDLIARIVTERRMVVWIVVLAIAAGSVFILTRHLDLDSDIINMLPGKFDSVQGLKVYNRDFEQTRELIFALLCQPEDVDKLDEYAPTFANILRHQAWVRTHPGWFTDGDYWKECTTSREWRCVAPLESLIHRSLRRHLSCCSRTKCASAFTDCTSRSRAGSPRPQVELDFDPLGLIGPAIRPFAEGNAVEEDQPLTSPDRTMRVFLVVTNQKTPSASDSQKLMHRVDRFCAEPLAGWGRRTDKTPRDWPLGLRLGHFLLSMRHDVAATLIGSIILVGGIFFVGFRRWLPLAGMGFSMLLSCLVGLAIGLLIFGQLNMVTIGFSAILVGLGVDFAIPLSFGRYQQARGDGESHRQAVATSVAKLGRAVFFGALTTSGGVSRTDSQRFVRLQ